MKNKLVGLPKPTFLNPAMCGSNKVNMPVLYRTKISNTAVLGGETSKNFPGKKN
jgi:hypothetical protein